jgi:pentatricopeptide repeat protein
MEDVHMDGEGLGCAGGGTSGGPAPRIRRNPPPRPFLTGTCHAAWSLLRAMHAQVVAANTFAVGSALRFAAASRCPALGTQLHPLAFKCGLRRRPGAGVHAKCGRIWDDRRLFDGMPERNTVSWNACVAGYVESGKAKQALDLFLYMDRRVCSDEAAFAALLPAVDGSNHFSMHQFACEDYEIWICAGLDCVECSIHRVLTMRGPFRM